MFKRSVRVLLVEDNHGLRKILATILRTAGLRVDTAADASDAFRLLSRHQYGVAVVDMVLLPGLGGIEVIRNLRSNSPATRVFACTAYCKGDLLDEALTLGVEQVMRKPVDPGLLVRLIQTPAEPARPHHSSPQKCPADAGCVGEPMRRRPPATTSHPSTKPRARDAWVRARSASRGESSRTL